MYSERGIFLKIDFLNFKEKFIPNMIGEFKYNYLTPVYRLENNNIILKKLSPDLQIKANIFNKKTFLFFIINKDEKVFF